MRELSYTQSGISDVLHQLPFLARIVIKMAENDQIMAKSALNFFFIFPWLKKICAITLYYMQGVELDTFFEEKYFLFIAYLDSESFWLNSDGGLYAPLDIFVKVARVLDERVLEEHSIGQALCMLREAESNIDDLVSTCQSCNARYMRLIMEKLLHIWILGLTK